MKKQYLTHIVLVIYISVSLLACKTKKETATKVVHKKIEFSSQAVHNLLQGKLILFYLKLDCK